MRFALFLALAACPAKTPPAPATPTPTPVAEATPPPDARLGFWREVRAEGPPDDADLDALSVELVGYLGSPDPEVRDGIAYEILAGWIDGADRLPPETLRQLTGLLYTQLEGTGDDAVLGRSFSALVLAAVAARELEAPFLTDEELAEMVRRAATFAETETDLRGRDHTVGWIHAPAHTADWLTNLASHPRLTPDESAQILRAVLSFTVRRHGFILHHGEDGRLAQPVLALLREERIDGAGFGLWLQQLSAPLLERQAAVFDPALYAAQRNARNLIFTLFVALSVEEAPNPSSSAALAALRDRISR